jgi:hypothetical protein
VDARKAYDTSKHYRDEEILYTFVSNGFERILKAIEYSLIGEKDGYPVFNLGFGNYDIKNDLIIDDITSNNGDVYWIFNTVLVSSKNFLDDHPGAMVMVRGSDSSDEFVLKCRETCDRRCGSACRNQNKRIGIYRGYIERNFAELNATYSMFGSFLLENDQFTMENYIPGRKYLSLFITKK